MKHNDSLLFLAGSLFWINGLFGRIDSRVTENLMDLQHLQAFQALYIFELPGITAVHNRH